MSSSGPRPADYNKEKLQDAERLSSWGPRLCTPRAALAVAAVAVLPGSLYRSARGLGTLLVATSRKGIGGLHDGDTVANNNVLEFYSTLCLLLILVNVTSARVRPSALGIAKVAAQVLAAWWFADLLSALVHINLDKAPRRDDGSVLGGFWDDQKYAFQWHHDRPARQFEERATYHAFHECNTTFPYALIAIALFTVTRVPLRPFLITTAVGLVAIQAAHYFAHARTHSYWVPKPVQLLQDASLILSPKHHREHHTPPFNSHFGILHGGSAPLVDYLFKHGYLGYLTK